PPGHFPALDLLARRAGFALLQERLQADQVFVQGGVWVRTEQPGRQMAEGAGWRVVAEAEVHAGPSPRGGLKADDPRAGDRGAGLAPPRQYLIRDEPGEDGLPGDGHAARPLRHPVRAAAAQVAHLAEVGHELREVRVVRPEREDALDRRR